MTRGSTTAGLQAAGQMLAVHAHPAAAWATSYPEVNPDLKLFTDPVHGETLSPCPPSSRTWPCSTRPRPTPTATCSSWGRGYADRLLWRAATRTLVQVEKVVSNEEIRRAPERTALLAHGVVRAPFGAHPFSSPGFYLEDRPHIALLVEAGRAYARNGDRGPFERYL